MLSTGGFRQDVYIFHKRQLKEDFGHLYAKLGFTIQAMHCVSRGMAGGRERLGAQSLHPFAKDTPGVV